MLEEFAWQLCCDIDLSPASSDCLCEQASCEMAEKAVDNVPPVVDAEVLALAEMKHGEAQEKPQTVETAANAAPEMTETGVGIHVERKEGGVQTDSVRTVVVLRLGSLSQASSSHPGLAKGLKASALFPVSTRSLGTSPWPRNTK